MWPNVFQFWKGPQGQLAAVFPQMMFRVLVAALLAAIGGMTSTVVSAQTPSTTRVDLATPLISDNGSKWGVNVTITSGRPRFWRPSADLARTRSVAQTPVVFGWP